MKLILARYKIDRTTNHMQEKLYEGRCCVCGLIMITYTHKTCLVKNPKILSNGELDRDLVGSKHANGDAVGAVRVRIRVVLRAVRVRPRVAALLKFPRKRIVAGTPLAHVRSTAAGDIYRPFGGVARILVDDPTLVCGSK